MNELILQAHAHEKWKRWGPPSLQAHSPAHGATENSAVFSQTGARHGSLHPSRGAVLRGCEEQHTHTNSSKFRSSRPAHATPAFSGPKVLTLPLSPQGLQALTGLPAGRRWLRRSVSKAEKYCRVTTWLPWGSLCSAGSLSGGTKGS